MSDKSINALLTDRCRAEARVLRAARAYAGASTRLDADSMVAWKGRMLLASFRLRDADRAISAWKRECRKRLRAAAARREQP